MDFSLYIPSMSVLKQQEGFKPSRRKSLLEGIMPTHLASNLFKPGSNVNAGLLFDAFVNAIVYKEPSRCLDADARKIIEQYSTPGELAADIAENSITGYDAMYPKSNKFLDGCNSLVGLVDKDLQPGVVNAYRPIRLSLFVSKKFNGKLMLGCYRLMRIVSEPELNKVFDSKYIARLGSNHVILPLFAICITLTNLIDLLSGLGHLYIPADMCWMAVQNWNDSKAGWLSKQRISEDEDVQAQQLVNDWDFLSNSMAVKLCKMDVYLNVCPRCKGPDGKDRTIGKHLLSHKAYAECKKYLASNADFGKPIMQAVKKSQGQYTGREDRFCILTDKAILLEWYMTRLNEVKSISFCDPVQIVEWYYGISNSSAFASKVEDASKIPMRILQLAYGHLKSGLGYGLDHEIAESNDSLIYYWAHMLDECGSAEQKLPIADLGKVLRLDSCLKQKDMCWGYDGFVLVHKDVNSDFDKDKPFMVIIDQDGVWQMHFENFGIVPKNEKVLDDMYKAVSTSCKKGIELQCIGGATPGGISGLSKLQKYGFKKVAMPNNTSVYWGGELDQAKLEKWLKSGKHNDDFIVRTDGNIEPGVLEGTFVHPDKYDGEITVKNTKPKPFKMVKESTEYLKESDCLLDHQIEYWAHMLDECSNK